jgi:uncharacterized protein YndB with AHSA1/START domain
MSNDTTTEGIEITRVFDAPRELVFRAWIEPESFADWFGGAQAEVPVDTVEMDVRPGGTWKATMYAGPDRMEIPWHGEYEEIDEPSKLVLTLTDRPGDARELLTVLLKDLGDGRTEMTFSQTGGNLDAAGYEQVREGWGGFFDQMEQTLAKA